MPEGTATTPTARILSDGSVQLVLPVGDVKALVGNDTVAVWGVQDRVRAALAVAEAESVLRAEVAR